MVIHNAARNQGGSPSGNHSQGGLPRQVKSSSVDGHTDAEVNTAIRWNQRTGVPALSLCTQGNLTASRRPQKPRQCHLVAVGTPVARRPPHRSVREELPHTAPTSGAGAEAYTACRFSHTQQTVRHAGPALGPGRGRLLHVPLGQPPSLHLLRRRRRGARFVRRLHRYYGAVRLPARVRAGRMAAGLFRPTSRSFGPNRPSVLSVAVLNRRIPKNACRFCICQKSP